MALAVHFGAGNIGRGFLGQLYFESGYETVFVDVAADVVEALQQQHAYDIEVVEDDVVERLRVERVDAVHGADAEAVAEAIARADIASTAVGVHALAAVAPLLARGLDRRLADPDAPPLNIIVCENMLRAGEHLRGLIKETLPESLHAALDEKIGLVDASIGRMVPVMSDAERAQDPLLVRVEPYCELPVDRAAFRGELPDIKHLQPRTPFEAYVEEKLFIHNMSHSATAYLGYLKGYDYVSEAIRDDAIRRVINGAVTESAEALARKHQLPRQSLESHGADLIRRYHNRALGDTIARVAGDPLRKLGRSDRLVGAAEMCLDQGVKPRTMAVAVAAAIRYDEPRDPAAREVAALYADGGAERVLEKVSGLPPEHPVVRLVLEAETAAAEFAS